MIGPVPIIYRDDLIKTVVEIEKTIYLNDDKKQYNKLLKNVQTQLMNAVADELETEAGCQGGEY